MTPALFPGIVTTHKNMTNQMPRLKKYYWVSVLIVVGMLTGCLGRGLYGLGKVVDADTGKNKTLNQAETSSAQIQTGTGAASPESFKTLQTYRDDKLNLPLQPGDKLDIFIWDSPELSQQVVIAPNGYFPFPMLKQVPAEGLTVTELQQKMESLLAGGILINPNVKITVLERRIQYFYVFGEVMSPQRLQYPSGEKIYVLKAVTMAGGFTDKANKQEVRIVRAVNGGEREIEAKMTDEVLPGDLVLILRTIF